MESLMGSVKRGNPKMLPTSASSRLLLMNKNKKVHTD